MKNAQLRRTLQNLVKFPNASQKCFFVCAKFKVFKLIRWTAHFKLETSEPESIMILRFSGFSGRGLSLKLLVFLNTKLFKIQNGAKRFYVVGMLYLDDGIPVNFTKFANEETWFELIGTAGRTFSYSRWICRSFRHRTMPAKGMLKKSQMSSWIVQAPIC